MQVDPLALTDVVAAGKRDVHPRDELQNSQVVGLGNGMSTTTAEVLNLFVTILAVVMFTGVLFATYSLYLL